MALSRPNAARRIKDGTAATRPEDSGTWGASWGEMIAALIVLAILVFLFLR